MTKHTFLFYDLETFGINPQVDRIAQFAGIRTDENFNVIGEPLVLYCKIQEDYLPEIEACLVTGITPQETLEKGINEYDFISKIHDEFSVPNTCVVGYNSIRFDDEFIRNTLYRNFIDPYYREWANGNSRWDIIDMVRMIHDLRPEGINWPINEKGKPSFKLESLTFANNIEHKGAHDALVDVRATIALINLIKNTHPKIYNYYKDRKDKQNVLKVIYSQKNAPILHTSNMFTSKSGCSSIVYPIMRHPKNNNCVLTYDLRFSPKELIELSTEEIEKRIFTKDLELEERVHIKGIHINRCPVVAPIDVVDDDSYKRMGIDKEECLKNLEILKKDKEKIKMKLEKVYSKPYDIDLNIVDPELQIYSGGFFPDMDQTNFELIHVSDPSNLLSLTKLFTDRRVTEMLWRFVCRNYKSVLSEEDLEKWKYHCEKRLLKPLNDTKLDVYAYKEKLESMIYRKEYDNLLLEKLLNFAEQAEPEL